MATIIGAIASSHTPTIGFALDANKQEDPAWKPIFDAYLPIRTWLEDKRPDVLLMIYNDHITSFFFDHYSAFCLGVDDSYRVADEGGGPRPMPAIGGHAALSRHIVQSLMTDEFDMSTFRNKGLDHGIFSPLSVLMENDGQRWPTKIVPLQVGVLQFPIPSALRCYKLGQALRRAIESYPEDIKVAIVATGGLSHQVHGERCGFNNTPWDAEFLDLLEKDPIALTRLTHADYARLGGMEGSEVIMWLVMRGALSASVRKIHQSYYLPSMCAIATAIYENEAAPMTESDAAHHLHMMGSQLAGISRLEGTYPYTLDRSARGWKVNKFLHSLIDAGHRATFRADEDGTLAAADLSDEERRLIRNRDWRGLIHYGAIFFLLEKLAALSGVPNPAIYAAMRGQSLEEFQKTRNQQVSYGVAAPAGN
ncbi:MULTISPECIES: gallate dioxygenase [Sphingobium]|jgi:gallate dioxygenase|uniref:Gallate dioxygenase n=2 Tax=Sphingobium TaxID=165695 RepID=A0A5J5HXH5_9SPHN|nr:MULTISPECIES: gallate dioxygenase [Sphingobium]EQB16030.1 protocatechuate 4,5-dioxygenase subunit alpha [Sphingobium lactosutens DS20]KAA9014690.1 gallate dioxygenase [Sphingobium limneticum]KAA9027702.1 gallate dioxygenase [Sphingobium limneticum]MBR2270593.1 gallate dioxygenase [Sphingobium sp.]